LQSLCAKLPIHTKFTQNVPKRPKFQRITQCEPFHTFYTSVPVSTEMGDGVRVQFPVTDIYFGM